MREQLSYRASGHLGQNETWWYLVTQPDGSHAIESAFNNTNLKTGRTHEGTEHYTLEEGRARMPSGALIELEKLLAASKG